MCIGIRQFKFFFLSNTYPANVRMFKQKLLTPDLKPTYLCCLTLRLTNWFGQTNCRFKCIYNLARDLKFQVPSYNFVF